MKWLQNTIDKLARTNRVAKVFLILATASCVLVLVLATLQLLTGYSTVGTTSTGREIGENGVPRYVYWCILEILVVAFVLYFAWDAVLSENRAELIAFQIASFLSSVYAVIQYFTVDEEKNTVGAVQLTIILTFQVAFWALAYHLHMSFGWWVFRRLGADVALKAMYRNYQLFLAQTKFDLQFGLMLVMMSVFFFAGTSPAFVAIELIMLGFTIFYALLGIRGIRTENDTLMYWFFGLGVIHPINILVKAFLIIDDPDKYGRSAPYVQMGITAGLALVNRVTLLLNGKRAFDNFGRGLKENAFDTKVDDVDAPNSAMDIGLLPVFSSPSSSSETKSRLRHPSLSGNDYDPNLVDASVLFEPTIE